MRTPAVQAEILQFLEELFQQCTQAGLSLSIKSHDHIYDSLDIYTFHVGQFAKILEGLYAKHRAIFATVPRVFQGRFSDAVPTEHIGFVQEPGGKFEWESHSGRMGILGWQLQPILEAGGTISPEQYEAACAKARVQPTAPWLWDESKRKY